MFITLKMIMVWILGAWIKLIRSKYWAKYDYSLMLMEGFLFSSNNVLKSLRKFLKDYKPDFISSGHEKRFLEIDKNFIKNLPANNFYEISTKKFGLGCLKYGM